jgi:hypothetical protein
MKQMKQSALQDFRIRYIADSSPLEGGASAHNKQIDKRTKEGDERPPEGGEHTHVTKSSENTSITQQK